MIKSITATTREIDDVQSAVKEILEQLNIEKNLLKNSLGIISCFSEFTETGVVQAICKALPFDCIGATTCICAAEAEIDQLIFAITVLTSDDCNFKTITISLTDNYQKEINNSLKPFLETEKEKPAVMLSYFPLINTISGDMILSAIDDASGGIPLYGTTAVDHMMDYSTAQTIYNGEASRTAVTLGAIYGNPQITFEIASLDEKKIRKQKAIITESNGNVLMGVNGKTAIAYLEEIGLTRAELENGLGILPLIIDHKDGTRPVARAVFALTPDGQAICGGSMPVNTAINIGRIDKDDVLLTTEQSLSPLVKDDQFILTYSCMARYLALGAHNTAEAEKVNQICESKQYLFACSGGEVCPLPDANGKLRNFYHNYTIVFCRLG